MFTSLLLIVLTAQLLNADDTKEFECTKESTSNNYEGPTALELLSPLFRQSSCLYRVESYWTFEVCHGRHIRQYHEDEDSKKATKKKVILGQWEKKYYEVLLEEAKVTEKESETENENKNYLIPVKTIDGISLPCFELTMGNGTPCELNEHDPRQTKVVYVCNIHGEHEIFSLRETSTCIYEVIILSPLLCSHPKYKPLEAAKNQINCLPYSPSNPNLFVKFWYELMKMF